MAQFNPALQILLRIEGGFAPDDAGCGPVKYGLNARFLRAIGEPYDIDSIRAMTPDDAARIYKKHYWDRYRCGEIISQPLAETFFVALVNMAPAIPRKALQMSVNDISLEPIDVDGLVGPMTLAAVNRFPAALLQFRLKSHVGDYYVQITKANPDRNFRYLNGWLYRLIDS